MELCIKPTQKHKSALIFAGQSKLVVNALSFLNARAWQLLIIFY